MVVNDGFTRIDILELKHLVIKKIGHQRASKYFELIGKFLSNKVSKRDFLKACIRTIGKENIPLHNNFIRSILKNAILAKVAPLVSVKTAGSPLSVKFGDGYQRTCLQSLYGEAFPPSPRKGRSRISRDRKFRDLPSPLGPLGKPQSLGYEESNSTVQEHQSAIELLSPSSRPPVGVVSVEDGEEVEQVSRSPCMQTKSPITAPLGISLSLSGAHKSLSNVSIHNNHFRENCQSSGELPDTALLRSRMEKKLETEGLCVSLDCVNLLNSGLNVYLKRLIEPCLGLSGSRFGMELMKKAGTYIEGPKKSVHVSMSDLHVVMQSNPQLLGAEWSTPLEKISLRAFEQL